MILREIHDDTSVRVTFTVPPGVVDAVAVIGDFNSWDPGATPFALDGPVLRASVVLEAGRRYAFRYVTRDGGHAIEECADDYERSGSGCFDSVIDLPVIAADGGTAPPRDAGWAG